MPSAQSKLEILIEAKNTASGPIKQIEGDLSGLDKAAGSAAGGLSSLAGAAGAAGIVALGTAIAGTVTELARGAAETERLGTAFDTLAAQAGQSGDEILSAMQAASRGTVSNADLMAAANRAMLLGVADSAQEMAQLMDVASARGKAMGETTAQAFSDLVTGLGRMSPLILDNLGITIDAEKAFQQYAQTVGTSADKLTDAQKKQALLNAVLADSVDLVKENKAAGDDAASNFERMDAAISNAKDALGELFGPAVAVIAQNLADAANQLTEAISSDALEQASNKTAGLWQEIQKLTQEYATAQALAHAPLLDPEQMASAQQNVQNLANQLMAYGKEYNNAAAIAGLPLLDLKALQEGIMAFDETAAGLQKVAAAAPGAAAGLGQVGYSADALKERLAALKAQSDATIASLNSIKSSSIGALESAANAAVGIMSTPEISRIYGENKKRIQEQIDVMEKVGMSEDDIRFKALELAKEAATPFTNAVEAAREAEKQNGRVSDSVKEMQKSYDELTGKVEGVLRGSLDPGVGVDPSSLLPREDAINEDARRLADVAVNGFASPWADYFKTNFPQMFQGMINSGDIKTGAAQLLQDFQDGLEPQLLDKGKVKDRVRRMLLGDQNMADLAQEIAGELSTEMGIPLQQALAATQSTMGGSGAGGAAATSFTDGFVGGTSDADTGGSIITTVDTQLRAKFGTLAAAGRDAAKTWGDAFLAVVGDNVPPALISMLTDLVTPQVIARFAQQQTQVGATP